MSELKGFIQALLTKKGISIPSNKSAFLQNFIEEEGNISLFNQIKGIQDMIFDRWELKNKIDDITNQSINIPNGTVGKDYTAKIELEKWNWKDIAHLEFEGLEDIGLSYNAQNEYITGTPVQSGDLKIKMKFRIKGEPDDSVLHERSIALVINPDPKSLWKNIASDKELAYWKQDDVAETSALGDRHIVVASKRGRSHANVGSFRDDDFTYKYFPENGWSIVAVADGAGSSKLSRQGSKLACQKTAEFFESHFSKSLIEEIDQFFSSEATKESIELPSELRVKIIKELYQIARFVHEGITDFANKSENPLKEFHSTLIFCLFKKIPSGYLILSFGVGDCPIVLIDKEISGITMLNWLDVGEYGGGTRFVTMPEIFSSDKISTRFNAKIVPDFSYLFLMTDGIYDPKFVVEANLEKIEKWKEFLADLDGNNEENIKVELKADNPEIAEQLSKWLDFWSAGNHDDRTLAIIF
ncbi:PP2C family serine/threonine-protein phosphatase [Emticicia fontis]